MKFFHLVIQVLASSRQTTQVGLTTPRRRLSQDPRSCVQCGRCFKYPSDLKKHLQIHTGNTLVRSGLLNAQATYPPTKLGHPQAIFDFQSPSIEVENISRFVTPMSNLS